MATYQGLLSNPNLRGLLQSGNIRQAKDQQVLAPFRGAQAARIPAGRPIVMKADNSLGQGLSGLGTALKDIGKMRKETAAGEELAGMYAPATQVTEDMTGPEPMAMTPSPEKLLAFAAQNQGTPAASQAMTMAEKMQVEIRERQKNAIKIRESQLDREANAANTEALIAGRTSAAQIKADKNETGNKSLDTYIRLRGLKNRTPTQQSQLLAAKAEASRKTYRGIDPTTGQPIFQPGINFEQLDKDLSGISSDVSAAINPSLEAPVVSSNQAASTIEQNINAGVERLREKFQPAPPAAQPIVATEPVPEVVTQTSTPAPEIVSIKDGNKVSPEVEKKLGGKVYDQAVAQNKVITEELSSGRAALTSLIDAAGLSKSMMSGTPGALMNYFSDLSGNLGGPEIPGAVDMTEFDIKMKKQILPGLRKFFGSAFSAFEAKIGISLGATKDMAPEKRDRLIASAIREVQRSIDEKYSQLQRVNKGNFLNEGATAPRLSLAPEQILNLDENGVRTLYKDRKFLTAKQKSALERAAAKFGE